MITSTGKELIKQAKLGKKAKSVEEAMGFVTDRILRPDISQTVPPTRKKKVDENGNILKPLIGHTNQGKFFGKRI